MEGGLSDRELAEFEEWVERKRKEWAVPRTSLRINDLQPGWVEKCLHPAEEEFFPDATIQVLALLQWGIHQGSNCEELINAIKKEGFIGWRGSDPGRLLIVDLYHDTWMALVKPIHGVIWTDRKSFEEADIDLLVRFLERNPYFFRTGYIKQRAISRLGRGKLNDSHRERIRLILERAVQSGFKNSLNDWARLARYVPLDQVKEIVREGLASVDDEVRRQAALLSAFQGGPKYLKSLGKSWGAKYWPDLMSRAEKWSGR